MAAKIKLNHVATALALLASGGVLAHGYISQPEGRNYLCKTGGNSQCGAISMGATEPGGAVWLPQWRPRRRPDRLGRSSTIR